MFSGVELPRLAYVGDVPVENSYHGSALLYRLLQSYPADRLAIVTSGAQEYHTTGRLKGVAYYELALISNRLLRTRFHRFYAAGLHITEGVMSQRLKRLARTFRPKAIVTVGHGYSWIAAVHIAERQKLPLHFIVHDDWPYMANVPSLFRPMVRLQFRQAYRQATTRLCISPYMEEEYRRRYGVAGSVLYPSRGANAVAASGRETRAYEELASLVIAFAGTINSGGHARLLSKLANALQVHGGEVHLFGPHDAGAMRSWALEQPNIRLRGLLSPEELQAALRASVDVLFVPMSFEGAGHEENIRLSFPSKIADYTATGLPLLIWGPDYCSAVRWAQEYYPIAEVVTSENPEEVHEALTRLKSPEHRRFLAERAMEVGNRLFSQEAAQEIFYSALMDG